MHLHVAKSRVLVRKSLCSAVVRSRASYATAACIESDIVIVGGGPAGLALASALGQSKAIRDSLRVTLVEAGDLSKVRDWAPAPGTFSNRVSSITNASRSFLHGIGAWAHVEADRTNPIEEMQVWDGITDARINFSASEFATLAADAPGEMAHLTENLNIQRALLRQLSRTPAVQLFDKVKVQSIKQEERKGGGWPLVHLSDGRVLRARLLVGADGFNSPVRAYAGIESYGWAYDTHAIVATLVHAPRTAFEAPNTVAYQRFLPTGPIGFLPLSPTVSSLVWSTKPPLAQALMAADPAVLVAMINAAFRLPEVSLRYLHTQLLEAHASGTPLTPAQLSEEVAWRERSHGTDPRSAYSLAGPYAAGVPPADADTLPPRVTAVQPGSVAAFPLRFSHADAYVGARTVLLGDAAHTVHPLAGQGLNLGLADAEALARCVEGAVVHGGDVGSHTALLPYARERYLANHTLISACDKLHKLYAARAAPVVWARSTGLEVLNELDTVKAALMLSAGAGTARAQSGWTRAAGGLEGFARAVGSTKSVLEGVAGVVGSSVQSALRQIAGRGRA
ncbi:ubiquinone biosynthesis hydrox [Amylocystis lapponica]|nr:ubiquinone biosynthesis hydrox [Amylocystis lapponica]